LIFNKYRVKRFIEISDFCWVYQGVNVKNNEPVFLKFEKKNSQLTFLESEAYCLYNLKAFGIPKLLSYGKVGLYNVLIEEFLGTSLYYLWKSWKLKKRNKKLNLKNVCMVALQILNRLEYIHSKNYIHKDIKPQNFINGRKDPHIIYIIDFGFSKKYKSSRTGKHIKYANKNVVMGSLSFISINANTGYEQSRRDDLEALGYMLIFLVNDNLPWMSIEDLNINQRMKCQKILNFKKKISIENLCKGLPEEFVNYVYYTRKLEFEEDPDYDYLRRLFLSILIKNQEKNDLNFFWIINRKNKKGDEVANSENVSNNKKSRGGGSKNRLYKQIKDSLENKKEGKDNSFQSKHANNLNFRKINSISPISKNNRENDNTNKICNNQQTSNNIFINISDYNNKYICNFNNSASSNKKDFIGNKNIIENKLINNKNLEKEIRAYNTYDKILLFDKEIYNNNINPQALNNKLYFLDKFCSQSNLGSKINDEKNNLINKNRKNPNNNFEKKKIDKNISAKKKNNYKTLYERNKPKELNNYFYDSDIKKNYFSSILDYDIINQNNNNYNQNIKINLIGKDTMRNIGQEKIIKNNNNYNKAIKNSIFHLKNKETSELKKNLFENNIDFKEFQNNKTKFLRNKYSYNKIDNHLALKSAADSKLISKANTNLIGKRDRILSGVNLKENNNYNRYNIKYNLLKKNSNNIILGNISNVYGSLNSFNIINNKNKISLTQSNEQIQYLEKEYNDKKKIFKQFKKINEFKFKKI
jgi:serine/threonine protein kinase